MKDRINSERSRRILIATHAPLSLEFGAGQMAINLAEAFRNQGHDVTTWSSFPLPSRDLNVLHWLQDVSNARKKIDLFLASEEPFDTIDCPAIYISKKVVFSSTNVIARSVQPDILYLLTDLIEVRSLSNFFKKPLHFLDICCYIFFLVQGWHRATKVLCLGSLELQWMKQTFSLLDNKLNSYVNTIASTEQELLSKIRAQRHQGSLDSTKFLWIGRWVTHKGTRDLIDFIIDRVKLKPNDSFTIAGCGFEAKKHIPIQLIESAQVKIIPTFAREDLYSLLAEHDVGLFTSKVEGWGLVLNEMLESGMTVYGSSAGGVPELHYCLPDLLRTFPPPLEISLPNPESCDWEKYYSRFTWQSIAERYLKIY